MSDQLDQEMDQETEDLLTTIEHVEETLTIMTGVVTQLKEQLLDQLGYVDSHEMTAEEFLECYENADGIVH
jgi:hypothetical protein